MGRRVDGDLRASADALPNVEQAVTNREAAETAFQTDRAGLYEAYGAEHVELAEGFGRAWEGEPGEEGVDYTVVDIDDFGILLTLASEQDCPSGSALYVWSSSGLPLFFLARQA